MFNDLEIRVLTCKKDVQIALTMIESLRKYDQFKNVPVYFHDDGTLDDISKNSLLSIENSFIISREYADGKILEFITEYENCKKYRFKNLKIFNNTKIKLFLTRIKKGVCKWCVIKARSFFIL